jgi:hypothetical protein
MMVGEWFMKKTLLGLTAMLIGCGVLYVDYSLIGRISHDDDTIAFTLNGTMVVACLGAIGIGLFVFGVNSLLALHGKRAG